MFGQVLYTQVKWSRTAVAILSVVTFALPAFFWRMMHNGFFQTFSALEVMSGFEAFGAMLVGLSVFSGLLLVAQPWAVDSAARHVYPLSLPLPWRRYVAMRFGAGAMLLAIPAVALWLGCLLVLAIIEIPATLQGYPGTLALRYLLGSLLAYSAVFALQYLSGRRAAHIVLAILVGAVVVTLAAEFSGNTQLLVSVLNRLIHWPGPLAVYGDSWMLIDV